MRFLNRYRFQLQFLLTASFAMLGALIIGLLIFKFTNFIPEMNSQRLQEKLDSSVKIVAIRPSPSGGEETSLLPEQPVTAPTQPMYGHWPYSQADPKQMGIIASYGMGEFQRFELMNPEAGKALMKMIYAARDDGVWIIPVSAFRSIELQKILFQDQAKRLGSDEAAAKVSAPPGYSEHHTGYAVDLADGSHKPDLTFEFEQTNAYRWLSLHAQKYDFELSFPPDNPQGINYEPWHWRFIGSSHAAEIFTKRE